jgi:hypothetical protein
VAAGEVKGDRRNGGGGLFVEGSGFGVVHLGRVVVACGARVGSSLVTDTASNRLPEFTERI